MVSLNKPKKKLHLYSNELDHNSGYNLVIYRAFKLIFLLEQGCSAVIWRHK
jgi:hypothetical protein